MGDAWIDCKAEGARDSFLDFAAESYGFDKAACRFLADGRERGKQLYSFIKNEKRYILRLVKCPSDAVRQTEAEMEWLCYLAREGAHVPSPLRTGSGALAVALGESGGEYVASAFSMAEGLPWDRNNPSLWNRDVFYRWGKAVGDMHRLSKDYKPPSGSQRRGVFSIRGMVTDGIKAFPSANQIARSLLDEIESLPKDKDSFGLIHNDLHPGNFLIDGERIRLFDFDGCAYSWYAFDIGNALFLALWLGRSNDAGVDFTNDIIAYFLKGYLSANHLGGFWPAKIPLFMMACKIALFALGCDCENPGGAYDEDDQKERLESIEKKMLFAGCPVDSPLFTKNG